MNPKVKTALPLRRLFSRTETEQILGRQVFADALAAGWLKPCAIKKGATCRKNAKVLYSLSDIRAVEERILAGEYPPLKL